MVTWNLWWRFGPWRRRRDAILDVLDAARPDICGLQEVWATGEENLAGWLAERLGMQWTWSASPAPERWQQRIGDPTTQFGNAILSRLPITDRAIEVLPPDDHSDTSAHTVLHARIQAPTGVIPFFTTQLTSTVGGSAIRCRQVEALCRFVASHTSDRYPPVVVGDLNAEPDADEIRLLGGHKTAPVLPGHVLVDAWSYAEPTTPGRTWDRRNPFVAASGEPSARIDYVLVGLPTAAGAGRVQTVELLGDEPIDGLWPSDHAGVHCTLSTDSEEAETQPA